MIPTSVTINAENMLQVKQNNKFTTNSSNMVTLYQIIVGIKNNENKKKHGICQEVYNFKNFFILFF